jgi:hypothetical protein
MQWFLFVMCPHWETQQISRPENCNVTFVYFFPFDPVLLVPWICNGANRSSGNMSTSCLMEKYDFLDSWGHLEVK